jgi:hypothetical protein
MVGFLNFDVWHWFVGYLVDDMRIKRDFPNNPDVSDIISSAADTACVSYSPFPKITKIVHKSTEKWRVKNANADSCFGLQWNPSKPTSL